MASILNDNLEDDLLPDVDDIRGDLLPDMGIRQYRIKTVRKVWSGQERGIGVFTVEENELLPTPRIEMGGPPGGLHFELRPQGSEEEGVVKASEISLAKYQEEDLTGGSLPANVEWYWTLEDGQGQGIRSRAYVLIAPPFADREKTIGWICYLRRAEGEF